jgi:hypothetical protein
MFLVTWQFQHARIYTSDRPCRSNMQRSRGKDVLYVLYPLEITGGRLGSTTVFFYTRLVALVRIERLTCEKVIASLDVERARYRDVGKDGERHLGLMDRWMRQHTYVECSVSDGVVPYINLLYVI